MINSVMFCADQMLMIVQVRFHHWQKILTFLVIILGESYTNMKLHLWCSIKYLTIKYKIFNSKVSPGLQLGCVLLFEWIWYASCKKYTLHSWYIGIEYTHMLFNYSGNGALSHTSPITHTKHTHDTLNSCSGYHSFLVYIWTASILYFTCCSGPLSTTIHSGIICSGVISMLNCRAIYVYYLHPSLYTNRSR